ncbi:MAG: hypothetical protein WAV40_00580 [Microgenomates group bacterium]
MQFEIIPSQLPDGVGLTFSSQLAIMKPVFSELGVADLPGELLFEPVEYDAEGKKEIKIEGGMIQFVQNDSVYFTADKGVAVGKLCQLKNQVDGGVAWSDNLMSGDESKITLANLDQEEMPLIVLRIGSQSSQTDWRLEFGKDKSMSTFNLTKGELITSSGKNGVHAEFVPSATSAYRS